MPGLTNTVAVDLAAFFANSVAGCRGASATPLDSAPGAPYAIVGPPRFTLVAGSWEQRLYIYPVHYLLERSGSEDRDQTAANEAADSIVTAFRTGISLSALAVSALVIAVDTDKFYTIGTTEYQSVDCEIEVTVMGAASYTA